MDPGAVPGTSTMRGNESFLSCGGEIGSTRVVKALFSFGIVPPLSGCLNRCKSLWYCKGSRIPTSSYGCLRNIGPSGLGAPGNRSPRLVWLAETALRKGCAVDSLDYDGLIQEALRDVVKRTLGIVLKSGLPGNHHFYITFRTDRRDVSMPDYLREQHPDEVTVVLQHQYWDLVVGDKEFSVTLSFNGKQERLTIPYGALVSFMDPSVKFGLQFTPDEYAEPIRPTGGGSDGKHTNVVTLDTFRKKT